MIYLDLDGVIVDFVGPALRAHGHDSDQVLARWPKGTYEIEQVIDVSTGTFWDAIDHLGPTFWSDLQMYDWSLQISAILEPHSWRFLTTPSLSSASSEGKHRWLRRHCGDQDRNWILCPAPKADICTPGDLLIDDSELNISEWRDAGGVGLLWPQPWNSSDISISQALDNLRALVAGRD